MSDETTTATVTTIPNPPHAIAFIIDGVVQDRAWFPDRLAAILLSNPTIVYATGIATITPGQTTYDPATKTFTHPDGTTEQADEYDPES